VSRELLASQVEICTPPSDDLGAAHERLHALRTGLAEIGRETGLRVFAAGTHPTAQWRRQAGTPAERYEGILDELRMVGERAVICGMHVHVEVARPEARLDLMKRLLPYLAPLLALSTSSPFWQGRDTGLSGYRLRAFGEMPRTGLPELFADEAEHARYVRILTRTGTIADASYLWWHLRPSLKYPTLELRIADSCTRLADTLAVAALYRCLVRCVERRPDLNAGLTAVSRGLIKENLWRAERDGARAELIDEAREATVPLAEVVEDLLALVAEDAAALGCEAACARARAIVAEGTSADVQRLRHEAARADGASERDALSAVVDWLADTTVAP
jgi:glutamate---cysteine ligase / carboxylate-amine ligase